MSQNFEPAVESRAIEDNESSTSSEHLSEEDPTSRTTEDDCKPTNETTIEYLHGDIFKIVNVLKFQQNLRHKEKLSNASIVEERKKLEGLIPCPDNIEASNEDKMSSIVENLEENEEVSEAPQKDCKMVDIVEKVMKIEASRLAGKIQHQTEGKALTEELNTLTSTLALQGDPRELSEIEAHESTKDEVNKNSKESEVEIIPNGIKKEAIKDLDVDEGIEAGISETNVRIGNLRTQDTTAILESKLL